MIDKPVEKHHKNTKNIYKVLALTRLVKFC